MADKLESTVNGLDDLPQIKSEPIDTPDMVSTVIPKEFATNTNRLFHEDGDCEDTTFFTRIDLQQIKSEPIDTVLDTPDMISTAILKEFVTSTNQDSDCEDTAFFTPVDIDKTIKCLEKTRLVIEDLELQLDWHLQQYLTLRSQNRTNDATRRQDLPTVSQLRAMITDHPESNKNFFKNKKPISNRRGNKKRRKAKTTDTEDDTDFSDEDSEEYEEEDDSEKADDPSPKKVKPKKKTKGKKVKDEIESDEDVDSKGTKVAPPKKQPAKRGRKPKVVTSEDQTCTPTKKITKGKKITDASQGTIVEIKDEAIL